jgi:hypothetical protein
MRINHIIIVVVAMAGCFSKPDRVGGGETVDATNMKDSSTPDTPVGTDLCMPAMAICQTAGGTCVAGTCVIDHTSAAAVTCPSGMPCKINCLGVDACDAGVKCGNATTCSVRCQATQCSTNGVDCGTAATCDVRCIGTDACRQGAGADASVECRASMCTVTCDGANACLDGIDVDTGGTCASHCCDTSCAGGTDTCTRDAICT